MHKRRSFEHERELRAIFSCDDKTPEALPYKKCIGSTGLAIEVELPDLIERVYVSPTATLWFAEFVKAMTVKWGFQFPVTHSELSAAPLY
jgi:hypothetical protein